MIRSQRGFTLIEVMVTIAILATLTIFTAQAIGQAIKAKGKLQGQIDDVSHMRDAIRLLQRDISLAYHYRDIEKELEDLIKKQNTQNQNGPPQSPPVSAFGGPPPVGAITNDPSTQQRREAPRRDPTTHFVGSSEAVNLVTMNGGRNVQNTRQAEFTEVGYSLRDCRSLREGEGSSKCLWRRNSPYVDLDVTKGGDEVVLLENVSEFKLRYIGKGKQDWVGDWRTDAQGDGATKGKFPQAVEVSLTVEKKEGTKNKKYSMQVVVPIHFPNNPTEGAAGAQSPQTSWPQTQGATQ